MNYLVNCLNTSRVFAILLILSGWNAIYSQKQNTYQKIDSLINQGNDKFRNVNFDGAQKEYMNALRLSEKTKNYFQQTKATKGIALTHYYLRDKQTALKWLHRSLNLCQKHHYDSLTAQINYTIGVMYVELIEKDSAEYYTYKAVDYWEKEKNYSAISKSYSILSEFYILGKDKNIKKANEILNKAEYYAHLSQDKSALAFALMKQVFLQYYLVKDYKKALALVNKAESELQDSKFSEDLMYAIRSKAMCLAKLGDSTAADYMLKWFDFKDSIFNKEKAKELSKYEVLYEVSAKERKILAQKLQIQHEKNNRILSASAFIIVLLLSFLFFMNYRKKQKFKTTVLLHEQNEKTVREIYLAEQNERIRIARDLHDSIGQKLSVMKMLLPSKEESINVDNIAKYLDETIVEVRSISHNLIPEILNLGLIKAVKELIESINASENIQVEFSTKINSQDLSLPLQTELSLYRIIQEITANIIRHSKTKTLTIELSHHPDFIQLFIADQGIGFDKNEIDNAKGIGWKNIYARIKLINGSIKINSQKNKGSNFLINIPL